MKKIIIFIVCGIVSIFLVGCGNIKESDLIDKKYESDEMECQRYDSIHSGLCTIRYEFKKGNVVVISNLYKNDNGKEPLSNTWEYNIEDNNILVLSLYNAKNKFEISNDLSTITKIDDDDYILKIIK